MDSETYRLRSTNYRIDFREEDNMIELNNIYNGDCLELMKDIEDKSVDMILCDLPYGCTARNKWDVIIPFDLLWEKYNRVVKDNGAIVLFGSGVFTSRLITSNEKNWRYNLIWEKTTPTGFLNANRMPLRVHEDICVFYKKLPTYNPQKTTGHKRKISTAEHKTTCDKINTTNYGEHNLTTYDSTERFPKSILKYPIEYIDSIITFATDKQKESLHPTQKPVLLCEYLIKTYTNENEVVLDNCMGSGSTIIGCINTNRQYIGIEKDEDIFNVAKNRIEKHKNI